MKRGSFVEPLFFGRDLAHSFVEACPKPLNKNTLFCMWARFVDKARVGVENQQKMDSFERHKNN